MRARPESITAVTPSMVTEDSATFVDRMTFRRVAGADGARLLLERQIAVQRQHREVAHAGQLRQRRLGAPDLARARQEHQHVAVLLVAEHAPHRAGDLLRERPIVGRGQVLDRDVEQPALAAHHAPPRKSATGSASSVADIATIARSGVGLAQPPQPGEREVGRDVALVQLVEHDRADRRQARRRQQPPHEQPLRHEAQARAGPAGLVEADRIADGFAHTLAQLARDARGREPRGQPPRLEHPDLPVARPVIEQRPRHPGRLARARAAPRRPRRPGRRRQRRSPAGTRRSAAAGAVAAPSSSAPCPSMGLPGGASRSSRRRRG